MTIRVLMRPHVSELSGESGINRVVEGYFAHLAEFDIELVKPNATSYDLVAAHAGITGGEVTVCHAHGLYWTGDFNSDEWEYRVNARVIEACRYAKQITVPSEWVANVFRRDMRLSPHVIPHGINWQDWQHEEENQGYVIWNKNRRLDACDNSVLDALIRRFPDVKFVSTLPTPETDKAINTPVWPTNFRILPKGTKTPHAEMKVYTQRAGVYLSVARETFGIGILEAMASGVPVLGWNFGGNSFLVKHGVSGYLAKPDDFEDLCEGLNYCLKHRQVLGQNGRELAKGWTWARACEMVAGVYRLAMEEAQPEVSVVIPVYNKSKEQVTRAIDSCLTQTLKPKEVVVVNDGSKEDYSWVETMGAQSYYPVKYINQPNQGVAIARNNGISHASTKYITCLDADDWLEPTFLEVCIKALESDRSLGIAYTSLRAHNSDGTNTISQWPSTFDPDRQLTYARKQNQVPTACVFRRDAWQRVGGYKQRYAPMGCGSEDAAFWSAICSIGYNARKVTDEALFNYSASGGLVHGNREYQEVDWLSMYPAASDGQHPFASVATPRRLSHPVRQYDDPVISVIIPVGPGHEKEVENALDSLEMQHFRKWEAIVVNDSGITNYQFEIDYLKAYPYVRLVLPSEQWQRGAGFARNAGVKVSRAPLLFFLDADDVLCDANALGHMLDAWNREQAIIYSDYLGKAIWNEAEAHKTMGANLLDYNKRTSAAVFKKQSADFDCVLAQRQPEYQRNSAMPYYHWCLVSVLIPKLWHNAIGGYDESMATWEDVDYHWRLARAGYCYYRLPEHLILYNYHKGNRREASQGDRQKHQSMIQYITSKSEYQKEPMGCNCGKRKEQPVITAQAASAMADDTMVEIEFNFPGSSTRTTYGHSLTSPTKQVGLDGRVLDYKGYARKKGSRFLVHVKDQRAHPDMFKLVPSEVVLPEAVKVELPEPVLIKNEY